MIDSLTQFAAGLIFGLFSGFAVSVFRPFGIVLVIAAVLAAMVTLHTSGVSGLVASMTYLVTQLWSYAPFFLALGLGKVLGVIAATNR